VETARAWVGETPAGVVIARWSEGGGLVVDRPALGRFRQPVAVAGHGPVADEAPVVDGVRLRPVACLPPDLPARAGWHETDGSGRRVLLTFVPEASFGEPMVLLGEGDRVVRLHPLCATELLGEDGTRVVLLPAGLRVDEVHMRPSTAHRERHISFVAGDVGLAGTVITPATPGPHPAAVVLHGAAGGQRDLCRLQAAAVLAAGVAVLIYDKPGHGQSAGPADASLFDKAAAAEAALDALAAQPDVDADRVGLVGFSNGMWPAPMVAARRSVAFLAGVGSPGLSLAECEVHRRTKVLRDAGVGPDTVAAVAEAWRAIFAIVAAGGATADLVARLDTAQSAIAAAADLSRYETPDYAREEPMLSPIPPPVPAADLVEILAGEPDPQVTYDPADDYARLGCPVFLQYGADDTSVPVDASAARIRRALPSATIRVYPGVEHMLNLLPPGVTGLTPEAVMLQFHGFRFAPGTWADLTTWLRETVGRA
jgi:pimeloyl-ACP methyl ester carboxylesterase